MKRANWLATIIAMLLLSSTLLPTVFAAPTINRPMEIIQATIEGGTPETVDPAWSYDTASAELIMQVYDPLVTFDGEHIETYLPALATDWTYGEIGYWLETYYYWPMHGNDQEATSFSPWVAPDTNDTAWVSDLPGGTVWSYPLVEEGRVFIGGNNFTAYDEQDGSFLWTFRSPSQPGYASVSVAQDDMVFFGTAEPGPGGCIYALNATTGQELWNFTTEGYVRGDPIIADGKLFIGCDFGSAGKVYCLNISDGSYVWDYITNDNMSSIAVAYGKVYAGCGHWQTAARSWVYCLNMTDGTAIWSFNTLRDLGGFVSVANGKVYFVASREGANCMVYALNATDGGIVWNTDRYVNAEAGRVAVAYGKVFIDLGYGRRGIYALDELNGDEIWAITGDDIGGGPVVADGKVFFARGAPQHDVFYAVDESDGAVLWTYQLPGGVHSFSSAIANGRVFVADHYDSALYAFGPEDRVIEIEWIPAPETSPEGLTWIYRGIFKIRTGVQWHDPTYGTVAPSDVEYTIERGMVQDRDGGPQWMLYEPLLNTWGAPGLGYDLTIPAEAAIVGRMIDHAVESNSTHVWFNLAFPSIYAPLMQILSQIWGSVLCKAWITTEVIGNLGRPDWDGVWGDHTGWVANNMPVISPLDDPTPVMMGCGPFEYDTLDYTLEQWAVNRFVNYWRGWPVDWPAMAGAQPAGYIDTFVVTWAFEWPAREALFLAGDVDYCAVPRMFAPSIIGQDGIRLIWPLPALSCDGIFYNFVIDPTTPYGPILPDGTFDESGIPGDFFGNDTWGIHTRKGFTLAFDYATFLSVAYLGEGSQPETAVIPGLPYYDPSIVGYPEIAPDPVAAENEFKSVPGLWDTGFTITVLYNEGNLPRETAANIMKSTIEALNPKFHVNVVSTDWRTYIIGAIYGILTSFIIGWLADYPDAHNFAFAFYHTYGTFSGWQNLSNTALDVQIDAGIAAPDGPGRAAIYSTIQQMAIDYCPSVIILQPIGRHFERDWMVGWYYNVIYPGQYPANHWKWYYVEEALESTAAQPYSGRIPVDVNYDGKVDMRDIGTVAASFGATYGPPIHARWVFRADINCDRKIDMKDIGLVAKNFGSTSAVWTPPP